ncbi:hypothetical protein F5Y08DRAFT_302786 [Xylaria arbuscula]|nr:hypothetical protein F5Y08DRAFT_302786 [Xylaria arbuscula]
MHKSRNLSSSPEVSSPSSNDSVTNRLCQFSWSELSSLAEACFSYFHLSCMALDETPFYENHFSNALHRKFAYDMDSCVALLVLALRSLVKRHSSGGGRTRAVGCGHLEDDTIIRAVFRARNLISNYNNLLGLDWVYSFRPDLTYSYLALYTEKSKLTNI